MDTAEVVVVSDRVATESWGHGRREVLQGGEGWADLDTGGVHDDVEEGDGGAGVVGGLVGEPDVLWAGGFLLRWVVFFELEEEDEAVDWLSGEVLVGDGRGWGRGRTESSLASPRPS